MSAKSLTMITNAYNHLWDISKMEKLELQCTILRHNNDTGNVLSTESLYGDYNWGLTQSSTVQYDSLCIAIDNNIIW